LGVPSTEREGETRKIKSTGVIKSEARGGNKPECINSSEKQKKRDFPTRRCKRGETSPAAESLFNFRKNLKTASRKINYRRIKRGSRKEGNPCPMSYRGFHREQWRGRELPG